MERDDFMESSTKRTESIPVLSRLALTRRQMLLRNMIEAWQMMQKTAWRSCPPPGDEEWRRRGRGNPLDFISPGMAMVLAPTRFLSRPQIELNAA